MLRRTIGLAQSIVSNVINYDYMDQIACFLQTMNSDSVCFELWMISIDNKAKVLKSFVVREPYMTLREALQYILFTHDELSRYDVNSAHYGHSPIMGFRINGDTVITQDFQYVVVTIYEHKPHSQCSIGCKVVSDDSHDNPLVAEYCNIMLNHNATANYMVECVLKQLNLSSDDYNKFTVYKLDKRGYATMKEEDTMEPNNHVVILLEYFPTALVTLTFKDTTIHKKFILEKKTTISKAIKSMTNKMEIGTYNIKKVVCDFDHSTTSIAESVDHVMQNNERFKVEIEEVRVPVFVNIHRGSDVTTQAFAVPPRFTVKTFRKKMTHRFNCEFSDMELYDQDYQPPKKPANPPSIPKRKQPEYRQCESSISYDSSPQLCLTYPQEELKFILSPDDAKFSPFDTEGDYEDYVAPDEEKWAPEEDDKAVENSYIAEDVPYKEKDEDYSDCYYSVY
ncbi:unnamed protein product [Bursaphelenchus okinawaensis]|uniref:Uncharacterized protein n=1 Tax=Bursaphelenchus okinawaensis TaxID=465554 RepID=A0A811LJN0_9BILA|nr:unnamed protein product [Bursaphelenchus okinawaensis]CAG9124881.1 unnamed protein product [Bursaphelenchus okinawaensis]